MLGLLANGSLFCRYKMQGAMKPAPLPGPGVPGIFSLKRNSSEG